MLQHKKPENIGSIAARDSLDTLLALQTLSVDTLHGFRKMVEKAEPHFRPIAERFAALHDQHVAKMDKMVREAGGIPDDDGSFMGRVNTAVVTLRAVFDDIDTGVMDQVRSGEKNLIATFDDAIASPLPLGQREALTQMKVELVQLLDETRDLG
jgi:uncharacterized protein (TIGR02284 family)